MGSTTPNASEERVYATATLSSEERVYGTASLSHSTEQTFQAKSTEKEGSSISLETSDNQADASKDHTTKVHTSGDEAEERICGTDTSQDGQESGNSGPPTTEYS